MSEPLAIACSNNGSLPGIWRGHVSSRQCEYTSNDASASVMLAMLVMSAATSETQNSPAAQGWSKASQVLQVSGMFPTARRGGGVYCLMHSKASNSRAPPPLSSGAAQRKTISRLTKRCTVLRRQNELWRLKADVSLSGYSLSFAVPPTWPPSSTRMSWCSEETGLFSESCVLRYFPASRIWDALMRV